MLWYVYLVTISAAVFVVQIAAESLKPPLQEILRIRRLALQWMDVFENIPLPKPRELAISSREIREHDRAIKNVREAQRIFLELGSRLCVLSDGEPIIRGAIGFLGLHLSTGAQRLICLSEIFATSSFDFGLQGEIVSAVRETRTSLAFSLENSRDSLVKLRLEPMNARRISLIDHLKRGSCLPRSA
jgi:hypothetical protein